MAITTYTGTGVSTLVGTWTHTDGDANETIAIAGTVWGARFNPDTTTGPIEVEVVWSQSVSGRITTLTVYNNATVTNGKFVIWYTPN